MDKQEVQLLILITTIVVLTLAITLVLFFLYFQRKKTALILEKKQVEESIKQEVARTKTEIRENALEKISWEIHDNVGQLLSVAKMKLNMLLPLVKENENIKTSIEDSVHIIGKSLQELRDLAKSLNPETIKKLGFLDAVKTEVERVNKLNFIPTKLKVYGTPKEFQAERKIILFRILQEFLNNSLKHSKATNLNIVIEYLENHIKVIIEDNGIGFDTIALKSKGIGLTNMRSRAKLIGAVINLFSEENKGTHLTINCSYKDKQNEQD